MMKGHRTHLPDSAPPDGTEAVEDESVMSRDLSLHQRSWSEPDGRFQEVGLSFHISRDEPGHEMANDSAA